jgi:hypothetical protein
MAHISARRARLSGGPTVLPTDVIGCPLKEFATSINLLFTKASMPIVLKRRIRRMGLKQMHWRVLAASHFRITR